MVEIKDIKGIATLLRRDVLESTSAAGSGHPTSCLSAADIVAALFFSEMKYDIHDHNNPDNDEFVLSKGHAAPLLYASLKRAGCIRSELLHLRQFHSPLEGHPMPSALPWVKVASGSLGQGLSVGIGMALAAQIQKRKYRTFVLLGDSECAEGQVWEAAQLAVRYGLNNLTAIIDVNGLGQRGPTMLGHNTHAYRKRFEAFGWDVSVIDGHDVRQILTALRKKSEGPHVIIADTIKGKGVSFIEGKEGWHGRALNATELQNALKELNIPEIVNIHINKPEKSRVRRITEVHSEKTEYSKAEQYSTREAYGNALRRIASSNPYTLVLDAEVSNSTHADSVKKILPKQFLEMYIAEQNMISTSLGLAVKGHRVFASSFSAFLSRAHDQIRMSALSGASFVICGSHAGCSIGEDGPSQMGLEDISMFRSIPNSTVLYPCDAISTEKLVELAYKNHSGINYIRTTRPKSPLIYSGNEKFEIGEFNIIHKTDNDSLVIAAAGITLPEALKASHSLAEKGINASVLDIYCIKPFNSEKFRKFVSEHGNKLVVAEDHYTEGGIGELLSSALSGTGAKISCLSVKKIPHSGTKDELLTAYEIDSKAIFKSAKKIIN